MCIHSTRLRMYTQAIYAHTFTMYILIHVIHIYHVYTSYRQRLGPAPRPVTQRHPRAMPLRSGHTGYPHIRLSLALGV